jgi:hypothetical protein
LTPTGLLMEGVITQNPLNECYRDLSPSILDEEPKFIAVSTPRLSPKQQV